MNITISQHERTESRVSYELVCGKKTAYVGYSYVSRMVDVLVYNASHAAWRGGGRSFGSFAEALEGYKSAEVKAMIEFVQAAMKPTLAIVA